MKSIFLAGVCLLLLIRAGFGSDLLVDGLTSGVITTREGCREVLTCTVIQDREPSWDHTRGGVTMDVPQKHIRVTNSTVKGLGTEWVSSVVLDPVISEHQGRYNCITDHNSYLTILTVGEGVASITVPGNIDLSDMEYGAEFTVRCVVETCLSDTVVQMFTGDQLVDSITEQERTKLSAYAQLRATEGVVGTYACQAMSEYANYVTTSTFEITGTPRRREDL